MRELLPDPWIPYDHYMQLSAITNTTVPAGGTIISSANRAIAVPVMIPADATLYELFYLATNNLGNYDLGLYRTDFTRIASTGSTAVSSTGKKSLALSNYRVKAGTTLLAALALSNTSGTALRGTFGFVNRLELIQAFNMNSALPLPDPFVGALPTEFTIPVFGFGVR